MLKQLLLISLLLGCALPGIAQRNATAPAAPLVDTVYFDRDWERTTLPEDRSYARVARHTQDGKTTGIVRDFYYPSWKKQWEGKLAQEQPDKPNGLCTSWHETGSIESKGTYVQGQAQADLQRWAADGHLVTCRFKYQEALALSTGKLHSYYNSGNSCLVFPVDLPPNTAGVVYRLDIRDEGTAPISWNSAFALGAAYFSPAVTLTSMLSAGTRALSSQGAAASPAISTKCHWYIVPDLAAAQEFMQLKGAITVGKSCYRQASNIDAETREIPLAPGTQRLYICVKNDNDMTAATATVSVSALVKSCE